MKLVVIILIFLDKYYMSSQSPTQAQAIEIGANIIPLYNYAMQNHLRYVQSSSQPVPPQSQIVYAPQPYIYSNPVYSPTPSAQPPPPTSNPPPPPTSSTGTSTGTSTSPPPPGNGKTEIDVYVYFDKGYVLITIVFLIALLISPGEYALYIFIIYVAVMIVLYLYKNGFKFPISISKLEDKVKEIGTSGTGTSTGSSNVSRSEVFNVANDTFTYQDAQAVCQAYGARLATYKEIEDAYKNGADWCNYGWSDGQNAFFPTQMSTYNQLQKTPGHEHDCGRPGINGGYVNNANFRFGANCYGKKPAITPADQQLMNATTPYPKNPQDIQLEKEVNYWKNNMNQLLVSSFNRNSWDEPFVRV